MDTDPKDPRAVPQPTPPAPRRRFRLEKLEERIAPKKGGKGTKNCGLTLDCDTSTTGGYGYSTYY